MSQFNESFAFGKIISLLEEILRELRLQNEAMSGEQTVGKQTKSPAEVAQTPKPENLTLRQDIEQRISQLGYSEYFTVVEERNEVIVVKTKYHKDRDEDRKIWGKVNELVLGRGGKYVGKAESNQPHFVIKGD